MHETPGRDPALALAALALTEEAARAAVGPAEVWLGEILVKRFGFGRTPPADYDDPANADLISVLESRTGLPVALAIVWRHAGRAAGATVAATDTPGHVLVRVEGADGRPALFDAFDAGRRMGPDELAALARRLNLPALPPAFLAAAPPRATALRLQTNLWSRARLSGDLEAAERAAGRRALIAPALARLHLDHAEALAGVGALAGAARALDRADSLPADASVREEARRLRAQVARRLN